MRGLNRLKPVPAIGLGDGFAQPRRQGCTGQRIPPDTVLCHFAQNGIHKTRLFGGFWHGPGKGHRTIDHTMRGGVVQHQFRHGQPQNCLRPKRGGAFEVRAQQGVNPAEMAQHQPRQTASARGIGPVHRQVGLRLGEHPFFDKNGVKQPERAVAGVLT